MGYTLGPLLGGVLVWAGGLRLMFTVLVVLGAAVAVWAALAVPVVPPLPKTRQTVLDLARRLTHPAFLRPTAALAAATAALSVGVGFLPVSGRAAGLGTVTTGAAVSVLAACAAIVQPRAGRALDGGRLTARGGITAGLLITAAGLICAMLPGLLGMLSGAALIGVGTGLITPSASPPWPPPLPPNGSAGPWAPPNSAANSATRVARSWSPPSPRSPPSPSVTRPSPSCSRPARHSASHAAPLDPADRLSAGDVERDHGPVRGVLGVGCAVV
nr:hypothetical protein [Streptomyces sp. RLB1-33]